MIAGKDKLVAAVESGRTVSYQAKFDEPGFRWAMTDTGETVTRPALNRALAAEKLAPVAFDMAGEPYEYGAAAHA